jgi:peptidoglycan/LPS O-acetylase OafA/YrhL
MHPAPRAFEGRSSFIDALRGIAAISVAGYHIYRYGPLPEAAQYVMPRPLGLWFDHGWIGVQVFFVISGFVIAYSVRDALITPKYLANYILRRSVRLDPPYWTTIVVVLLVHWFFSLTFEFTSPMDVPTPMRAPLSWGLIVAHLFYVQDILGDPFVQNLLGRRFEYENLSAGFWTLCIEVQFYLLYVIGLGLVQRLPRNGLPAASTGPRWLVLFFGPLAAMSLFWWNNDSSTVAWIIHFFCMFFLGSLAWWALDRKIPSQIFWGYVLLIVIQLGLRGMEVYDDARLADRDIDVSLWEAARSAIELKIALLAGVAIYGLGVCGKLGTTWNTPVLQYLGKISYSLYLIHFPVSHVVTTLGYEHMLINNSYTPLAALGWLGTAMVVSLVAAHGLYTFVEAPSVRLGSRLKRH